MSDSEQKCDNCNCQLANVEIYVLTKGIKEQTWCSECVQTFWQDLKSEGWVADDGTWSELGFDDGEDKPDPCKDCGNEAVWDYKFDRWSVVDNLCPNCSLKEEQEEDEEEDDSVVICSARCIRPATTVVLNKDEKICSVCDECKEQMSK